jgi:hypothetical protein
METRYCEMIYKALIDGAYDGLSGDQLVADIKSHCPEATALAVAHATLLALSDADVSDPEVLGTLCGLAMKQSLAA